MNLAISQPSSKALFLNPSRTHKSNTWQDEPREYQHILRETSEAKQEKIKQLSRRILDRGSSTYWRRSSTTRMFCPRLRKFRAVSESKQRNFEADRIKSNQHKKSHTSLLGYFELIPEISPQKAQSLDKKIDWIRLKLGFSKYSRERGFGGAR